MPHLSYDDIYDFQETVHCHKNISATSAECSMDRLSGLGDLLTVKGLAPKATPWSDPQYPQRNAFSLPSAALARQVIPVWERMEGERRGRQGFIPAVQDESCDAQMPEASATHLWVVYLLALVATFFTNLQAVPFMSALAMGCCCALAQSIQRLWLFALALIPVGAMMGVSTWGFLKEAALIICVLLQIPMFCAYLVHRRLTIRHPELWSVTLAFPCVTTALWVLSSIILPIGSEASPAYNMAGQNVMFIQCSAWLGRSCSWLAAAAAQRWGNPKSGLALKAAVGCYLLLLLAGGLRFYAPSFLEAFGAEGPESDFYFGISCLSYLPDMFATTKDRLDAGDNIIIHAERSTDIDDAGISSYKTLLQQHYDKSHTEALVVLCFTENERTWYKLVTRNGTEMSYAKNHPVPFVETDIGPGNALPGVAQSLQLSSSVAISATGTICFDTDFPYLTRSLSAADLLLESSATWANIGQQHLRGHQYVAVENGQTLVMLGVVNIEYHGGLIVQSKKELILHSRNIHGRSIVYQAPQTTGVVSFQLPQYPKLTVFPMLYMGFDGIVGLAACVWILLACSPQLSTRWLGRCHLLPEQLGDEPRSHSKEVIGRLKVSGLEQLERPPLPSLGSLPRRILPRCSGSSLEDLAARGSREAEGPSLRYVDPLHLGGPAAAWATSCEVQEVQVETCQESSALQGEDVTISLPGDAFSFAEAVDTPEDVLSELRSASDDFEDVVVEDLDGDAEGDEDRALETEAEDNVDEGDDLDFAKDSDSDQPGATQEDVGQCDEAAEPSPSDGYETPGVEELLLMDGGDGTEQVIIVKKKKKKRKKKRKKRQKVVSEEVTVEKKPPVPRFPHPTSSSSSKEDVSCAGNAMERTVSSTSERVPLRERFAKHLLLGRFPKRKSGPVGGAADASAEADDEEKFPPEAETDALEDVSASEDQAVSNLRGVPRRAIPSTSAAVQRAARARARALRPPRVVRIKRILQKEPDVREESEKTETDGEAKGSPNPRSFGLVAKAMPLRRGQPPKTVWKEPVVETLLSLGSLYFSFSSMRTPEGKKVPLKNRDKVVRTLHELNTKVALPICRQFGLRYNFFSEHHPQAKKAGVTCKEPLILRKQGPDGTEVQETRYLVTIRLRLRLHPTKGDPQTDFVSHGTQIAVLLHELCHLKHMNHGKDFMLFLRDIFAFAHKTGVFAAGESNEIPSPWPWENLIFQRAGDVSDDELLKLFAEHREKQRQVKTPERAEEAKEPNQVEAEAETEAEVAPEPELPEVPEALDIEAVSTSASDGVKTPPRSRGSRALKGLGGS
eukprot:s189_g6.t1